MVAIWIFVPDTTRVHHVAGAARASGGTLETGAWGQEKHTLMETADYWNLWLLLLLSLECLKFWLVHFWPLNNFSLIFCRSIFLRKLLLLVRSIIINCLFIIRRHPMIVIKVLLRRHMMKWAIVDTWSGLYNKLLLVMLIYWRKAVDLSWLFKGVLNITSSTLNLLRMLSILTLEFERDILIFITTSSSCEKLSALRLLDPCINRSNIMLSDCHICVSLIWLTWHYLRGQS